MSVQGVPNDNDGSRQGGPVRIDDEDASHLRVSSDDDSDAAPEDCDPDEHDVAGEQQSEKVPMSTFHVVFPGVDGVSCVAGLATIRTSDISDFLGQSSMLLRSKLCSDEATAKDDAPMIMLDALFPEATTPMVGTVCISTEDATELADNTCAFRTILLQNNHVLPPGKKVEAAIDHGDATHHGKDLDSLASMEVKYEGGDRDDTFSIPPLDMPVCNSSQLVPPSVIVSAVDSTLYDPDPLDRMEEISQHQLTEMDVVTGRGPLLQRLGNQAHRHHVQDYYDRFIQAPRQLAQEVVDAWRRRGGRYFRSRTVFEEMDDESAYQKVRECLYDLRRNDARKKRAVPPGAVLSSANLSNTVTLDSDSPTDVSMEVGGRADPLVQGATNLAKHASSDARPSQTPAKRQCLQGAKHQY
jgi:hypothetical protein